MEKMIVRIYLENGKSAKKHFWDAPVITKKEGVWNEIKVWIYKVPEYVYKEKDWKIKTLEAVLYKKMEQCYQSDYFYLPYSKFEKKYGSKIRSVPTAMNIPDFIWEQFASSYPSFWGIVILEGYGFYYEDWIYERAKTLKFLGIVGNKNPEQVEDLIDDISQEYGLNAIYADTLAECRIPKNYPVLVLDASEEEKIDASQLHEGSIWIDFSSNTAKRRRLETRYKNISYISLKKELEIVQYLDTD